MFARFLKKSSPPVPVAAPADLAATMYLSGYCLAHALWCVADGEVLIPFVGESLPGNRRLLTRFAHEYLEDGIQAAWLRLAENPEQALAAVAVHDGYISLPEGKTDALLANICLYGTMPKKLDLALPYRHAHAPQPFAVHRPKLLAYEGFAEEPDWAAVFEAFFDGVAAHEQGAAIWQQALDESC